LPVSKVRRGRAPPGPRWPVEQQDANLRRALRTAGPRAAERNTLEIETLGAELAAGTARLNDLQLTERPIRITKKLVDYTIAQVDCILERAPRRPIRVFPGRTQ
jgi:hypothetical protein